MYQKIAERGTGKTKALMLEAQANNGIFVCRNAKAMIEKAKAYGITGFDIISYYDYYEHNYDENKPIYVDELDMYVKYWNKLDGYSLTIGD